MTRPSTELCCPTILALCLMVLSRSTHAQVELFDLEDPDDVAAWEAALLDLGTLVATPTEWEQLPNWGVTTMDGPVDTETSYGPIQPGVIPFNLALDSNLAPQGKGGPAGRGPGGEGMVAVGPGEGFSNPTNLLGANFFNDSLDLFLLAPGPVAMELTVADVTGGDDAVVITVEDERGDEIGKFGPLAAGPGGAGHRYGIASTDAEPARFGRVNIWSPDFSGEGVLRVVSYNIEGDHCPEIECASDIDRNEVVDSSDLAIMLGNWGDCPPPPGDSGDPCNPCPSDLDGNETVDSADLAILLGAWGLCNSPPPPLECDPPGTCADGFPECFENCVCAMDTNGRGVCISLNQPSCADAVPCPDAVCPEGLVCVVGSCCGFNVCLPLCGDAYAPAIRSIDAAFPVPSLISGWMQPALPPLPESFSERKDDSFGARAKQPRRLER